MYFQTTALAALFLASKSQDNMKQVLQIACLSVQKTRNDKFKYTGQGQPIKFAVDLKSDEEVFKLQQLIIRTETQMLRSLAFDLALKQPFTLMKDACKRLDLTIWDFSISLAVFNDS